jgi:hypothetical protein
MSLHEVIQPDDKDLVLFCMKEAYNATCERLHREQQAPTPDLCALLKRVSRMIVMLKDDEARHGPSEKAQPKAYA